MRLATEEKVIQRLGLRKRRKTAIHRCDALFIRAPTNVPDDDNRIGRIEPVEMRGAPPRHRANATFRQNIAHRRVKPRVASAHLVTALTEQNPERPHARATAPKQVKPPRISIKLRAFPLRFRRH